MAPCLRRGPGVRPCPFHRGGAVGGVRAGDRHVPEPSERRKSMIARSRAPLRLGLAGGGTDVSPYCDVYGGNVMNVTIDRYAYAIVAPGNGTETCFHALDVRHEETFSCSEGIVQGGTLQLIKGVYARVCRDFLDGDRPSLTIKTFSDAPPGSGLGSSSTMVVALLQAFVEYFSLPLGEYEVAQLAYD